MHVLIRHRWLVPVDPAGAPSWLTVLERLGHRVVLDPTARLVAVDSALQDRTVILQIRGADPGGARRLAEELACRLRAAGAVLLLPGAEGSPGDVLGNRSDTAWAGNRRDEPAAARPLARVMADAALAVHLDPVAVRATVRGARSRPVAAWRLARALATALWRHGCLPVRQQHWPGLARKAAAAEGRSPAPAPAPAAAGKRVAAWPESQGGLRARAAAWIRAPAGWPPELLADALYSGLVAYFGGPRDHLAPLPGPAAERDTALPSGGSAGAGTAGPGDDAGDAGRPPAPVPAPTGAEAAAGSAAGSALASEPPAAPGGTLEALPAAPAAPEASEPAAATEAARPAGAGEPPPAGSPVTLPPGGTGDEELGAPVAAEPGAGGGHGAAGDTAGTAPAGTGAAVTGGPGATAADGPGTGADPAGPPGEGPAPDPFQDGPPAAASPAGRPARSRRPPARPAPAPPPGLPEGTLPPGARHAYVFALARPAPAFAPGGPVSPPRRGTAGQDAGPRAAGDAAARGAGVAPAAGNPVPAAPFPYGLRPAWSPPGFGAAWGDAARPPGADGPSPGWPRMGVVPSFATGRQPGSLRPFR